MDILTRPKGGVDVRKSFDHIKTQEHLKEDDTNSMYIPLMGIQQ